MRKLLNTFYITNEQAYLSLDGENIVCKVPNEKPVRVPFDNIENIVCFSYLGCSPALMGKCVDANIPINFVSPHGRCLAKLCGGTKGNVFLRVKQIESFHSNSLKLCQNTVAAKLSNTRQVVRRSMHDDAALRSDNAILKFLDLISTSLETVYSAKTPEEVLGIEGNCAKGYFGIFGKLIKNSNFTITGRVKHPPLDPVNAVLSFIYTLMTNDCAAALETVGLDSYIGFYHTLRSGRESLACDLVEEFRCFAERFVLTVLNLQILDKNDFDFQVSGTVFLNNEGRKKVLEKWQGKKRETLYHPYLGENIPYGLLPYVQSNLLARFIRGDISEYPPYLYKKR